MFSRFIRSSLAQVSALLILATSVSQAAVSYLMVQGDFGSGMQTHKWKVEYTGTTLTSGQSLLNAVFGVPAATGTNVSTGFGTRPYYASTQSATGNGAGYALFDFGMLLHQLTINNLTLAGSPDGLSTWNYLVAGGDGTYGGPYASGTWEYAGDGAETRTLSDGSFDSWVYGEYGVENIGGTGVNAPTAANFQGTPTSVFTGSGFIVSYWGTGIVPEPGRGVLLMLTGVFLVLRRKR